MVVLEAATVAAQMGWMNKDKFQKIFRETYNKAFPDFDLEKVFWQAIYGDGIFLLASLVWRSSQVWQGFVHIMSGEAKEDVVAPTLEGVFPNTKWVCPEGYMLVKQYPSGALCVKEGSPTADAAGMYKIGGLMDIMDEVLVGKYFSYVLMSIPALFLLLELKNWKTRKRAKGLLK